MNKAIFFAATAGFLLAAPANSFAEPIKGSQWELAPEAYYYEYREPDVMKETGIMYGLSGAYAYRDNFVLKAEARFAYGQVDYKNSGDVDNINDYAGEARGLAGYDFAVSKRLTLTPFIGAGFRYLNDDLKGKSTSTGAVGYERESHYFYSPIGIDAAMELNDGWSLGASAEFDYLWWGLQKSHLSDVDPAFDDLENKQRHGYGIRGALRVGKKGDKLDWFVEPFIRYWHISQSEEDAVTYSGTIWGSGYEPKNRTTEVGVRLGARF